jgi:transcriptional regulator with XRE-family HTH domain
LLYYRPVSGQENWRPLVTHGPSPYVRRRRLGTKLRNLREAAGLTGDQVIASVKWASASKLSRLENGRSKPDLGDVFDLLDLYEVKGHEREELILIARDAGNTRAWMSEYPVMTQRQKAYAEFEASSVDIREFALAVVPGLLQTPDYARVRLTSSRMLPEVEGEKPADLEQEVSARVARQSILSRDLDPPQYEAVLDEASVGARGGPADVMRDQVEHLCRLAELPNVTLRVLPRETRIAEGYLPQTGFSIYRFADPQDPETVAVESLAIDLVHNDEKKEIDIARYSMVYEWLREAAMPPDRSLEWLTETAERSTATLNGARPARRDNAAPPSTRPNS